MTPLATPRVERLYARVRGFGHNVLAEVICVFVGEDDDIWVRVSRPGVKMTIEWRFNDCEIGTKDWWIENDPREWGHSNGVLLVRGRDHIKDTDWLAKQRDFYQSLIDGVSP